MKTFEIANEETSLEAILIEANSPKALLILAHGAGAGMQHPFLNSLANALSENTLSSLRFNFPYMTLGKKFPGNPKLNIMAWKSVLNWAKENFEIPLFIGGKSYGGRMASHLITEDDWHQVNGIVYYGFPLHAPGKNTIERANHLDEITIPQLFLQGSKDSLASPNLIKQVFKRLPNATLEEIDGGDHSFKVKGVNVEDMTMRLAKYTSDWIQKIIAV